MEPCRHEGGGTTRPPEIPAPLAQYGQISEDESTGGPLTPRSDSGDGGRAPPHVRTPPDEGGMDLVAGMVS